MGYGDDSDDHGDDDWDDDDGDDDGDGGGWGDEKKENATCAFFPTSFRGSTLRIRTFTTVTQSFDRLR